VARVEGWSEREVERRAARLARLLRRAWRVVSRGLSARLTDAAPGLAAAQSVPAEWNEQVDAQVLGYLGTVYVDAAEDVVQALDAPTDLLVADDLVAEYLKTARNRLAGVGEHAWGRVRDQLLESYRLGESIPETAARIQGVAGISDARALTIARTEVHTAAEAGAYAQALFVDPDAGKIWLATEDERTRPSHRAVDGQRVAIGDSFQVGDSRLRYPGDPLGAADETVNCRCSVAYDFDMITPVTDTADEGALVAAAKKWNPTAHPRGKDGRFIKKGAVQTLLSKKKPLITDVTNAVYDLDEKQWKNLTDEQKTYLQESVDKLPLGSQIQKDAQSKLDALQNIAVPEKQLKSTLADVTGKSIEPGSPAHSALTKGNYDFWDAVSALDQATWNSLTDEQRHEISVKAHDYVNESDWESQEAVAKVVQLYALQKPVKPETPAPAPALTPAEPPVVSPAPPTPVPQTSTSAPVVAIPAHKGSAPGTPAKVSTTLIWGKYEPGTVILEVQDAQGYDRVVWNGKKYELQSRNVDGEFKTISEWTKKDAYAELKTDTQWKVPGAPTAEDFQADVKSMWQSQWEKGLVTTEEFQTEFGESPQEPPDLTPAPPPESAPNPASSWPDQVTMAEPLAANGKPLHGGTTAVIKKQLDAAATKPGSFDPDKPVQEGRDAFYVALQSGTFVPGDKDQWNALRTYQSHAAEAWNHALRHDIPLEKSSLTADQLPRVQKAQGKLDEMMAQSSLPTSIRVWRGVKDHDGKLAAKLTKGSVFEDKGYSSTATDRNVAEQFAGYTGLVFDIEVPKGEQGLVPTRWSGRFLEEWELVLPRGSKFEVVEEPKSVGSRRVVKVRVITNQKENEDANLTFAEQAPTEPQPTSTAPSSAPEQIAEQVTPGPAFDAYDEPEESPSKAALLGVINNGGSLTVQESVDLVQQLDQKEWDSLTDAQRTTLALRVDDALDSSKPNANAAFARLNELQAAQAPSKTTQPTFTADQVISNWKIQGSAAQSGFYDEFEVIAQTTDGKAQLVQGDVDADGEVWLVNPQTGSILKSYTPAEISNGSPMLDFPATWILPPTPAKMPQPALAVAEDVPTIDVEPGTFLVPLGDDDELWGQLTDLAYATKSAPQTIAQTDGGPHELRLIAYPDGALEIEQKSTISGKWFLATSSDEDTLDDIGLTVRAWLSDYSSDWHLVQHDVEDIDTVEPPATTSTLPTSTPTPAPAATPSLSAPALHTPTPTPTTTVTPSGDTSVIPVATKKVMKDLMKDLKTGYWSKPAAIWDSVKKLQKLFPHPNDDTKSEYSAMQILKALDEQLKTKEPNPFQTKMVKWLQTPQGKAYAGAGATLTAPSAQPIAQATSPAASPAGKLPADLGDISHLSAEGKKSLYAAFKKKSGTFYTSPESSIYTALKQVADSNGVSLTQVLRVVDEVGAQKVAKPNAALFEKKITAWLGTPVGAAFAENFGKPKSTPSGPVLAIGGTVPPLAPGFDINKIPTFAESSGMKFEVLPTETATNKFWAEVEATYGPLNGPQKSAVKKYTGSAFVAMNDHLRGKKTGTTATINSVKSMQRAMRPSTRPIRIIRGTNWVGKAKTLDAIKKMIGQTWRSDGFLSGSIGNTPGYGDGKAIWLEIEAPTGTHMVWADPTSKNQGEREMILAAGTSLRIISVEEKIPTPGYHKPKIVVRARVVPDPKVVQQ
jgi:hypothetical protein